MQRLISMIAVVLAFLAAFTGTAIAAEPLADGSLVDLAKPVLDAVMGGNWWLGAALALVFATTGLRRYGGARWPWLKTDEGGTLTTLMLSLGGALATALAAGTAPSLGLLVTALGVAVGASGGYTAIRRLLAPALRRLAGKLPGPLGKGVNLGLDLLLWAFESHGRKAVAKAEAAGQAAVEAKPAQGAAGVLGAPKDIP